MLVLISGAVPTNPSPPLTIHAVPQILWFTTLLHYGMAQQNISLLDSKFGSHRVEEIYREEQLKMVKLLNNNLDQLSLQGVNTTTLDKKKKYMHD